MPIRITGMNSGLDTDSVIQALMSAYRVKGDKYKKEQTKISWKQDKWKALNSKVLSLYKSLDNLRFSSGYNLKKVTISDTTKATVSGASNAMNGTQTLKINQLAQAAYLTGDKISAANGKTKLSDLIQNPDGSPYEGGTIRISGNGKTKDIEVKGDTTVNDFLKQVNDSGTGVTASYDSSNKRIYISSKKTGSAASFELSAADEGGSKALSALGLSSDITISKEEKDAWANYSGADAKTKLTDAVKAIIAAKKELAENEAGRDETLLDQKLNQDSVKYLQARQDLLTAESDVGGDKDDASAMAQLLKMSEKNQAKTYVMGDDGKLRVKKEDGSDDDKVSYTLTAKKYKEKADGTKEELTADNPVQEGEKTAVEYAFKRSDPSDLSDTSKNFEKKFYVRDEYEEASATAAEKAIANLKKYSANENTIKKFEKDADSDMEAGDYGRHNVTLINDADLATEITNYQNKLAENKTDLDDYNAKIKEQNEILAKPEYAVLGPKEIDVEADDAKIQEYVDKLAYYAEKYNSPDWVAGKDDKGNDIYTKEGANPGAKMMQGTDAEIELNGVSYTSTTNSFNINGLSIQAQAKTNGDDVTVTTATDTQGIYDKIKDFVSEYNSLIAEIGSLYNAESAKGYEPLTSEEKELMSDKEIEEWETKVKDALLRRDDSLGSLMNTMTSAMLSSVKIGDKSYSLASLGIKTTGYFHTTAATRNELHIDGDEDDDTTSSKTNTLMNMLNSDPDKAIDIIKGVTGNLYKVLNKKLMTSNSMKSINSIYNDKEMKQSYSDYTKTIKAWDDKIQKIEDSYYKKFSAMEVALSKLQSQQSSLAGLFGQM